MKDAPLLRIWFDIHDSIHRRPPNRNQVLGKGRSHLPYRRQGLRLRSRRYQRGFHHPICPYSMRCFGREHHWRFEGERPLSPAGSRIRSPRGHRTATRRRREPPPRPLGDFHSRLALREGRFPVIAWLNPRLDTKEDARLSDDRPHVSNIVG